MIKQVMEMLVDQERRLQVENDRVKAAVLDLQTALNMRTAQLRENLDELNQTRNIIQTLKARYRGELNGDTTVAESDHPVPGT